MLGIAWRRWLRIAEVLGNIQLTIFLSLIYWTFLMVIAVPFKLLADPLTIRHSRNRGWIQRHPPADIFESMKKQG